MTDADWDGLADRAGAPPWLRPGWVRAWHDAFGRGTLEVVSVEGALVPLQHRRGALHSPTNWHTPAFGLLGEDADARLRLARRLFERRPRAVSLAFVDDDLGAGEVELEAARARYRLLTRVYQRSPYLPFDGDWRSGLGKSLAKNLRRYRRKLEERGPVELELVADGVSPELLGECFALEATGWKARAGTAIAARPETAAFYRAVAAWAAERGTLRLFLLRCGGRAVAFELDLEENGRLYSLKTGFDEELRGFSPGTLLLADVLDWASERGFDSYEFLGGEDAYKLQWTRLVRERWLLQAFAPVRGAAEWAAYAHVRPLARRVARRLPTHA